MPTIPEIVSIRPIAQYLAQIDIPKRGLMGGGRDILLPEKIRLIGRSVQRIYDFDANDSTLQLTGNFLYTLLGIYGLEAMIIEDNAGTVSPIQPSQGGNIYPFYIHSNNFESDGKTYLNSRIAGDLIAIFIDEGSQQFFPSTNFTYVTGGGFTITADWFDATQFDYTVRVEKYYPPPS